MPQGTTFNPLQFFTPADYWVSLPVIMLSLFACGLLIVDLMIPVRQKVLNAWIAIGGLGFTAATVVRLHMGLLQEGAPRYFSGFRHAVVIDGTSIFFFYLFLASAAITIFMSAKYLEAEREHRGEYYALLLFSTIGMFCLAMGRDLVLLFIGLELMSISIYVLVGFLRTDKRSNEAALKYLLLGAFSSGILAYGFSLLYGLSGSTNLAPIARALERVAAQGTDVVGVVALVTTSAGLFFKIAAVPFHMWAPDAYEGAPTTVTGFMSVAVKAAAWALTLRIFLDAFAPLRELYMPMIVFVALATMTVGNLAAITQSNTKRLLAYSSIAHVGFMLLGLLATTATGVKGILMYLLVYTFMNLGAFGVIASLRRRNIVGDQLDDISGLWFKAPREALLMLVFLLSLAGVPPLAGFYGKYFIFLSLIESGNLASTAGAAGSAKMFYVLATVAVLYVAISLYYYLRIANAMFMRPAMDTEPVNSSPGMQLALAVTAIATIGIGVMPEWFIRLTEWSLGLVKTGAVALR